MFETASIADFERMLSDILERASTMAGTEIARVQSDFIKHGAFPSSRFPLAAERDVMPIHERAIADAMRLLLQFAERTGSPVSQLESAARPKLEEFTQRVTERIVQTARQQGLGQMIDDIKSRFARRIDHALKDAAIGFMGGNSIVMTESQTSQSRALLLLKAIYDTTHGQNDPVFIEELADRTQLSESEAQSAWRYLKDKRLIDTFSIPYTARINGAGEDVVEKAQQHPDRSLPAFPAVTYNVVNNTVNIGSAVHSPIQQGGAHAMQTQTLNFGADDQADLRRIVDDLKAHIGDLNLDVAQTRKVQAQLATIEAQMIDEPDPVIVAQAGRTLRSITEGAIGSLIAAGVQPAVWTWVHAAMQRLFS